MNTDPKILTRRPNPETDTRTSQTSEIIPGMQDWFDF